MDVIDENLDINYDTEVITVLYLALSKIFQEFKIPKEIEVHINNKKFIELLFDEL